MIHMIKDKDKKMISNSVKGWNFMVIRIIIENMYPSLTVFIIFHKETRSMIYIMQNELWYIYSHRTQSFIAYFKVCPFIILCVLACILLAWKRENKLISLSKNVFCNHLFIFRLRHNTPKHTFQLWNGIFSKNIYFAG